MWAFLYIFILGDIPEQQFEFFLWVNLGFCSYYAFFKEYDNICKNRAGELFPPQRFFSHLVNVYATFRWKLTFI